VARIKHNKRQDAAARGGEMSLDVYLVGLEREEDCFCANCINTHKAVIRDTYFDANITHNLRAMAKEANICDVVWEPENYGITKASDLIAPLRQAIDLMRSDPPRFEKHNSPNGWGLYKNFLPWLEKYLAACEEYPDARVRASR
jgi:hypothetical protein